MNGIINFYKPKGMTSHDAVNFFRRLLNIKRIGHTGTLDPNVTGVLPVCIGKATRVSEYMLEDDKVYIGEITFGIQTDSQDSDGEIINKSEKKITKEDVLKAFSHFTGEIEQIPPMYSAVKHKGRKLYELAREGIEVERKARKAIIYSLDVIDFNLDENKVIFQVKCSKGTYIRTLCNDIGLYLDTYAYMSHLIRVHVGEFNISNSYSKEYLSSLDKEEIEKLLKPIDYPLKKLEKIVIDDNLYKKVVNGDKIYLENSNLKEGKEVTVYCMEEFIGIARIVKDENNIILKMRKVFV